MNEDFHNQARLMAEGIDAVADQAHIRGGSVPSRGHPLNPGPEDFQIDLRSLASNRCGLCAGKGVLRTQFEPGAPIDITTCSCAEKGYQKFMAKRNETPCRRCGKTGWCEHRPRTLKRLLQEKAEIDLRVRAAFAQRPPPAPKMRRADTLRGTDHGGSEQESNRQDQSGAPSQIGGAPGFPPRVTNSRRRRGMPGVQPGDPNAGRPR